MNGKHRATVLVLVLAVLAALTALPVLAQEAPNDPPACPLTEGIVINAQGGTWGLNFIRSDRDRAAATAGPGAAVVPAGTYNVVLAAWDEHDAADAPQLNEQWVLLGLDAAGEVVYASGATPDIADDQELVIATVDSAVEISGFTQAAAVHPAFRNTDSPNSVHPLCASFIPVPDEADLAVTLVDSADPVLVGDTFDYDLTVSNLGPDSATGVSVALALPAQTAFVSAPAGCVHSGEASDGTVTCDLGDLAVEGSAALTVSVQALVSGETPALATALVASNELDADPSNNQASEETTIESLPVPQADLAVTVTMPDVSLDLGDEDATFNVVVTNYGPDTGDVVVGVNTLPAGFTLVSVTSAAGTCTEASGVISCALGSMTNGQSVAITVVATPGTFGAFVFQATVGSSTADPNLTNNAAQVAFNVVQVLPQVITTTTTAAPTTTAATQETLPFTGASTAGAGGLAVGLILLGGLVLLVGSSRLRYDAKHH
jgi:uncharacterized repeat protein (TIGR01451 family)